MNVADAQTEALGSVSVIIPVYNSTASLGRCLESVFGQTLRPNEVIVVNDGSTDNIEEFIQAYQDKIIYLSQANQGPAAARNAGMKIATSEFIAFLDADDYWLPDFLMKCVTFLQEHSEAIAVSVGQLIKLLGKSDIIRPHFLAAKTVGRSLAPLVIEDFFNFWATHSHITTGSNVIRLQAIKLAGFQRGDLRLSEDLEYWGYLATYGKWGFIPEVLLVCDPMPFIPKGGWMKRYKKRYEMCPTIEEWQKRLIPRLQPQDLAGFHAMRGRVAFAYAHAKILSSAHVDARSLVSIYGHEMPNNLYTTTLRIGDRLGGPIWWMICRLFRLREYVKSFLIGLKYRPSKA